MNLVILMVQAKIPKRTSYLSYLSYRTVQRYDVPTFLIIAYHFDFLTFTFVSIKEQLYGIQDKVTKDNSFFMEVSID